MVQIVVSGGGIAGCAAALAVRQAGARVTLVERTDMLIAGAIRAGRMNTNGKVVSAEESKALGGGSIYETLESLRTHWADIPGENNTYIYDCGRAEPEIRRLVERAGVEIRFEERVSGVVQDHGRIQAVRLAGGGVLAADAFIDATGTSGGIAVCNEHGRGCVECVYRCPTFGDRVSLVAAAGIPERSKVRPGGKLGAVGAGLTVTKGSLAPALRERLEREGQVPIPLPKEMIDYSKVGAMSAPRTMQQAESIHLTDIGCAAKCTGLSWFPLTSLRQIPGFENAEYESPLSAGRYNRITKVDVAPWELSLRVVGTQNLFCAGEKLGISGVSESAATGYIAGCNAVRCALGLEPVVLPTETGLGGFIAFAHQQVQLPEGLNRAYSLGNGAGWAWLQEAGLYTTDVERIHGRIAAAGLTGVLAQGLV